MKKLVMSVMVVASSFSVVAADDFASFDVDGNGAISIEEAATNKALSEQFKSLDTDGNGELSKDEFASFKGE
jgi:Ca2+-binding EF-hand superfamily protein